MSKTTNPDTETSISCGFFNRKSTDPAGLRKYDALQMSSIFDGVIQDGIFKSIGDNLVVISNGNNTVTVGTGKCWFDHTWTLNDAPFVIDCGDASVIQNRIDAIVVEIDNSDSVRDNFIKFVMGTPSSGEFGASSGPKRPTMTHTDTVNQYALCYIDRPMGSSLIRTDDITNAVGTDETPFITSILQTTSIDNLNLQWNAQLNTFRDEQEALMLEFKNNQESDFNSWYDDMKDAMSDVLQEAQNWTAEQESHITTWFTNIKGLLGTDPATELAMAIEEIENVRLKRNEIERFLMYGLPNGTKTFSDDGKTITTSVFPTHRLIKQFNDDFTECTTTYTTNVGMPPTVFGTLVKTFNTDGSVTSTMTISNLDTYSFIG